MPTPVAHALAGIAVYGGATRAKQPPDWLLATACITTACFADTDFALNFITGQNYHHYFTHSIVFCTFFSLAAYFFFRFLKRPHPCGDALIVWVAYATHLGLDLLSKDTAAPYGLELYWPFSQTFVISPVTIFDDIWRGSLAKLFGLHNWLAVGREVLIVGPVVALVWWWRHRAQAAQL